MYETIVKTSTSMGKSLYGELNFISPRSLRPLFTQVLIEKPPKTPVRTRSRHFKAPQLASHSTSGALVKMANRCPLLLHLVFTGAPGGSARHGSWPDIDLEIADLVVQSKSCRKVADEGPKGLRTATGGSRDKVRKVPGPQRLPRHL